MGKSKGRAVTLTYDELRKLCEEAVDKGIARYINDSELARKRRSSGLLHNTKVLLEHYRSQKKFIERATASLQSAISEEYPQYTVEMLEVFGLRVEDKQSYSLARRVSFSTIIMSHVDRMLDVYREQCQSSANVVEQRRWEVIKRLYIQPERMSTKEIAEEFNLDPRAIQEDAKRAREDLKALFFGIEALSSDFGMDISEL